MRARRWGKDAEANREKWEMGDALYSGATNLRETLAWLDRQFDPEGGEIE